MSGVKLEAKARALVPSRSCLIGALKRRAVLVVLGVEPSDRPDGLFDMGRKERRGIRVGHGLSSTT